MSGSHQANSDNPVSPAVGNTGAVSKQAGEEASAPASTAGPEALSQQTAGEDTSSAAPAETTEVDTQVEIFLAAIRADDAEGIAASFNRFGELLGTAGVATIVKAVQAAGLRDAMLASLKKRSEALQTPVAWTELALAAAAVGEDGLACDAARSALQADPAIANAAFIITVIANRQGRHDDALRVIEDIAATVPAAKDDPQFIMQSVIAELGNGQPQAALVLIESALPRFIEHGLEFDALVLRGRSLTAIEERGAEAVSVWERALGVAIYPTHIDVARDGLVAALFQAKRYDESLSKLDYAIEKTTNEEQRLNWLEARPSFLEATGDIDGAIGALDGLLACTSDPQRRVKLRLKQANTAALASRWKESATYFDSALSEIPATAVDAKDQRHAIQMQKGQTLFTHDIDSVLTDLDELEAAWTLPAWPVPIDLGMVGLMGAERASEALAWLEKRITSTPALADHPAAHQLRGEALLKLRRIDDAMMEYNRAVEVGLNLTEPRACTAVLTSAVASQRWQEAVDAYNRLDPTSATDATLRVIASQAYLRAGDLETALKLTDDAEPSIQNILAMRGITRGEALLRLGRYDDALGTADDALKRCRPEEVSPEFMVSLHLLRAQALNEKGKSGDQAKFEDARAAATAAIDVPDQSNPAVPGLPAFVRLAALMQRSLALYRLGKTAEAQRDIDSAITGFDRMRDSDVVKVMKRAPEFERFETQLWYAKGAVLDAESRSEEALAAYTRSEQLEKHGAAAAIARAYALSSTGAFRQSVSAFDNALVRVASPQERAEAFAGKGRALIRLERYEEAIAALQSALDARLTEPDDDPVVFEQLGIAYNSLQRNGAAKRAFHRAWKLTDENKRSANLARGVSAADLRLGDPAAAFQFLDELPAELADDRSLQFNRALALDGLGRRRAAIRCLVRAKDLGLNHAQTELDRLDAPAGLGRWTHFWFGGQASQIRRAFGIALVTIAAVGLAAPLFQWWLLSRMDWYLLLLPSVFALLLLALPNMKSITIEAGKVKLSAEPLPATGREAAAVGAPESFNVTMLGPVAITTTESKFP